MSTVTKAVKATKAKRVTATKNKSAECSLSLTGLCATCNHARKCGYLQNQRQPVVFCEEFDSFTPPLLEEQVKETAPTAEEMREWDEYKGLCVNCDNRKDCTIRNKEIGVWHCEEYQ